MGQIKNIKLHIVTDIKWEVTNNNNNKYHHDVQSLKDCSPRVEECCPSVVQTTSHRETSRPSNINISRTGFLIAHIRPHTRHRSCRQVHRCRSRHRWCCRIRCWYRNSVRKFDHRLRQESIAETTAILICYSWVCVVRSYGTFLAYDGFLDLVRL